VIDADPAEPPLDGGCKGATPATGTDVRAVQAVRDVVPAVLRIIPASDELGTACCRETRFREPVDHRMELWGHPWPGDLLEYQSRRCERHFRREDCPLPGQAAPSEAVGRSREVPSSGDQLKLVLVVARPGYAR
jgi:hypothetical protein